MKTLEALTKEITEVEAIATKNVEEIPYTTRGSWASAISDARLKLKGLTAQYRAAILQSSFGIIASGDGPNARRLADLVQAEGEGVAADAEALYVRIAKPVDASMGDSRQFGVQQVFVMTTVLKDVMYELGLDEIPSPSTDKFPILKTYDDVVSHIRDSIRSVAGDGLNRLYVEAQIATEALKTRYNKATLPVVLINASPEEVVGLSTSFSKGKKEFNIDATDEVNRDFMVKIFKDSNNTSPVTATKAKKNKEKNNE